MTIEMYNNMARYNLIDTKYRQMAFRSPSDGAPISPYQQSFGTPGQTKVSGDRQRETTHEDLLFSSRILYERERFNISSFDRIGRVQKFDLIILDSM